jgi:hypothetical protein
VSRLAGSVFGGFAVGQSDDLVDRVPRAQRL